MKKRLAIFLFCIMHGFIATIDPYLLYGIGSAQNVPIEYSPVLGQSFLQYGVIQSWLNSGQKNALTQLTGELFFIEDNVLQPKKIVYLTPESIGGLLRVIHTNKNDLIKMQTDLQDFLKGLEAFKDFGQNELQNLSSLVVNAFKFVTSTTDYPQGSTETLFLAYLCAISNEKIDIEHFYQGYLRNKNFVLSENQIIKTTSVHYKNYFDCITASLDVESFVNSFSKPDVSYDALQKFVLLFFKVVDGKLFPDRSSESFIYYITNVELGTIMRMIQENHSHVTDLIKSLRDYLFKLQVADQEAGSATLRNSFNNFLETLSDALNLVESDTSKYSYNFFQMILDGCVCSRLKTKQDVENYTKGLFLEVTQATIASEIQKFSCCIATPISSDQDKKEEEIKERQRQIEEAEEGHKEDFDLTPEELLDEMVEQMMLDGLQLKQANQSTEAVIFELSKIIRAHQLSKKQDDLNQELQEMLSFGGFKTLKDRKKRLEKIQKERKAFDSFIQKAQNIEGALYQTVTIKTEEKDTSRSVVLTAIDLNRENDLEKKEEPSYTAVPENNIQRSGTTQTTSDVSNKPAKGPKEIQNISIPRSISIPKQILGGTSSGANRLVIAQEKENFAFVQGFMFGNEYSLNNLRKLFEESNLSKVAKQKLVIESSEISSPLLTLSTVNNYALIPAQQTSKNISVTGKALQPTVGNLVLGLQKTLGIEIVPGKDTYLMIDPSVAMNYLDKLADKLGFNFDFSQFDFSKKVEIQFSENKVIVDFGMQRESQIVASDVSERLISRFSSVPSEEDQRLLLPAAAMIVDYSDVSGESLVKEIQVVPPQKDNWPVVVYSPQAMSLLPENFVAGVMLSGFMQQQEIEKYMKTLETMQWMKNVATLLEAYRSAFEFIKIMTPTGYEKVAQKINEIINKDPNELVDFVMDPKNSPYRKNISQNDIDQYFEHGSEENIKKLILALDTLSTGEIYSVLNYLSKESLASFFKRAPIDGLVSLLHLLDTQQKIEILNKVSQDSLSSFVNDLNPIEFQILFQGMNQEQLNKLKLPNDRTVYDYRLDLFAKYLPRQGNIAPLSSEEFKKMDESLRQEFATNFNREQFETMKMKDLVNLRSIRAKAVDFFPKATEKKSMWSRVPTSQNTFVPSGTGSRFPVHQMPKISLPARLPTIKEGLKYTQEHAGEIVRSIAHGVIY